MLPYSQWREILKDERLPAALVDLDAFDRNAAKIAELTRAHGKTMRIATKSLRVPDLIARVLERGAPFRGLMCYAAEEAVELRARLGVEDLLVAYPTVQPSDLRALRELHDQGARVTLMIDSEEQIRAAASAMDGVARPFALAVDVDASLRLLGGAVHLGVRRSPVRGARDVLRLVDAAAAHAPRLRIAGVMAYEAQVAGLGDRNPFKKLLNPVFGWIRRASVRAVARERRAIADALKARGHALDLFNGGGSGSLNFTLEEPWLTEATAGSGLLCSHLFDYYSNIQFEPSCFFALQASRSSDPGYATCLGGGYIASGEPGWDKVPRPWLPEGTELVSTEGCGEVQTPVRLPAAMGRLPAGAPILFRHAKAGELAERFNEYLLVSGGKLVGRAKTYRGLGLCFS